MDTITHGIAGALVAKSFFSERHGRAATFALTAASVFPDSDSFATLFSRDSLAFIEIHRGITHSLVMLPVFSLLFGCLTALAIRDKRKWPLFSLLYGIGIGLHILLDVITSYGTMIWSPLSYTRVSWDLVFIIDVVFTSTVLLPQLIAWVYSDRERSLWRGLGIWIGFTVAGVLLALFLPTVNVSLSAWDVAAASVLVAVLLWMPSWGGRGFRWRDSSFCRAGVAALALYLLACSLAHRTAFARVQELARSNEWRVDRIAALPSPPSLLRWSGLVESEKGIYRASIDLASSTPPSYMLYPDAEENRYVQAAQSLPDVHRYLRFARFPWVTFQASDGFNLVEFRDVQFFWPPRGRIQPFTFQVFLDHEGHVKFSGLLRR